MRHNPESKMTQSATDQTADNTKGVPTRKRKGGSWEAGRHGTNQGTSQQETEQTSQEENEPVEQRHLKRRRIEGKDTQTQPSLDQSDRMKEYRTALNHSLYDIVTLMIKYKEGIESDIESLKKIDNDDHPEIQRLVRKHKRHIDALAQFAMISKDITTRLDAGLDPNDLPAMIRANVDLVKKAYRIDKAYFDQAKEISKLLLDISDQEHPHALPHEEPSASTSMAPNSQFFSSLPKQDKLERVKYAIRSFSTTRTNNATDNLAANAFLDIYQKTLRDYPGSEEEGVLARLQSSYHDGPRLYLYNIDRNFKHQVDRMRQVLVSEKILQA